MGAIGLGLFFVAIAAGLFFWRKSALDKVLQLKAATTRKVSELIEMAKTLAKDMGKGHYGEMVEVRGKIVCDQPLISELAKQRCVYYRAEVKREYEETKVVTDSQTGRQKNETRRGNETLSSNKRCVPFHIEDETGKIEVLPDGADIDEEKALSRFDPESALLSGGNTIAFGGFQIAVGNPVVGGTRRSLGYHLDEWILPAGKDGFAIGEVTDNEGKLVIRKPSEKGNRFIISTRSKEALIQATESTAKWLMVGSIACLSIGVIVSISGLVKMMTG